MSAESGYALGYSTEEERRLALQASIFERLTEDVLRHAGIGDGMDVLDIGCGVGDVSFGGPRICDPAGWWRFKRWTCPHFSRQVHRR
jgi:hypothetical protein